ncbi:MAG: hypothetical protein ABS55_01655 [Lautropia sp. SCN 70-15]|jgi:tRNA(fMet)-specific endonuclease VapC|nr:MAG: hypothetical protein ABS55_01655 [Lautropia sp. SCN 70-15]
MPIRYLLDTNVISEMATKAPDAGVARALTRYEADCALPAPVLEELQFGVARLAPGRKRAMLEHWLAALTDRIEVLPYDAGAATWLGRERARLAGLGKPAPRADGEIAAIAVTQGLTLVTRNLGDFAGFEGLFLENWHTGK